MSNEPRWLTSIDQKIGRLSIQFDSLLRELRSAWERIHELEEENKQLRKQLAKPAPEPVVPEEESHVVAPNQAEIKAKLRHLVSGEPPRPFRGRGKQS